LAEISVEIPAVKAGVIYPHFTKTSANLSPEQRLWETVSLAAAINLNVLHAEIVKLRNIHPDAYFGKGVIERLKEVILTLGLKVLTVDADLTPIQQRNLEKALNIKIIDRTVLILEIFGERAQTTEGSLQVELAHLIYQRSRLVRSWTHLERQRGGAGFLGGPGETQIELDRRIIDDKIVKIKKALEKIKQTRGLQRIARQRVPYPIIALVGYTNTGKSTLFNYLTKANVFAKDLLFATLDTTMRRIKLPSGREVILSDTVGFISELPHELIMAFRATLEEVLEADIVVQVLDASNTENKTQRQDVLNVLHQLGLEKIEYQDNYIEVYNKIDLLTKENAAVMKLNASYIAISALSGEGLDRLLKKIDDGLSANFVQMNISVAASDGKILSWLYQHSEIINSEFKDNKIKLKIKISAADKNKLEQLLPT
jgi:GTP-binding protein HflX